MAVIEVAMDLVMPVHMNRVLSRQSSQPKHPFQSMVLETAVVVLAMM
jgi:hypothetical protein